MNQCILTGNLGEDPKEFFTPDGTAITSFQMAFKSGNKTSWIRVSCYKKQAELAMKCLHKGARVGVIGALDQQKWTDNQGNQKSNFRLIANNIEFIKTDGRGFNKEDGDGHEHGNEGDLDDIPEFP